jgi:hypothetical protein
LQIQKVNKKINVGIAKPIEIFVSGDLLAVHPNALATMTKIIANNKTNHKQILAIQ